MTNQKINIAKKFTKEEMIKEIDIAREYEKEMIKKEAVEFFKSQTQIVSDLEKTLNKDNNTDLTAIMNGIFGEITSKGITESSCKSIDDAADLIIKSTEDLFYVAKIEDINLLSFIIAQSNTFTKYIEDEFDKLEYSICSDMLMSASLVYKLLQKIIDNNKHLDEDVFSKLSASMSLNSTELINTATKIKNNVILKGIANIDAKKQDKTGKNTSIKTKIDATSSKYKN